MGKISKGGVLGKRAVAHERPAPNPQSRRSEDRVERGTDNSDAMVKGMVAEDVFPKWYKE